MQNVLHSLRKTRLKSAMSRIPGRTSVWIEPAKIRRGNFNAYFEEPYGAGNGALRQDEFIKRIRQGEPVKELARYLGRCVSSTTQILKKMGFTHPSVCNLTSGWRELKLALENPIIGRNGWPDAGDVEQKLGSDHLRKEQWLRAAWFLKYYKKDIKILIAKSNLDAVLGNIKVYNSVHDYLKIFNNRELIKDWARLIKLIKRQENNGKSK